ncbi:uncharacterized protein LOC133338377 [Musca vetustissima]|uniref:uncharacterized protein LOC133338377 n=1 Tax=Musca vetustissima TaxID=27455 RepID=UPI002AB7AC46|nr:uncharacterized protein LOC133338377 [Musca vetustissima]
MAPNSKTFWIEFIDLYKSLPELWRRSSDEYSNRHLKNTAYEVLLEKYKEIDASANVYTVKRKINNIRTCFRRELSRVKRSEQMALSPKDVYVPRLWYYKNLEFLKDEEEEIYSTTSKTERMGDMSFAYSDDDDEEYNQHRQPSPIQTKSSSAISEEYHQYQEPIVDKAKALSISWEVLYRNLNSEQQLYANRMINEILYQAALGKLQEGSYKLLKTAIESPKEKNNYSDIQDSVIQYYLEDVSTGEDEEEHNERKHDADRKPMKRTI